MSQVNTRPSSWCEVGQVSTTPCRILMTTCVIHKERVTNANKIAVVLRAYERLLENHDDIRMRVYYDYSIQDAKEVYEPLFKHLKQNKQFEFVKFQCTSGYLLNNDGINSKGFVANIVRLHALCEGQRGGATCVCPVDVLVMTKNSDPNDPYYDVHLDCTIRTNEWIETVRTFAKTGKEDVLHFYNVAGLESYTYDDGSVEASQLMRPCMIVVRKSIPLSSWNGLLSTHMYKQMVPILRRFDAYRTIQMGPKSFGESLFEDFGWGIDTFMMSYLGITKMSTYVIAVSYPNGKDRVVDRVINALRWSGDRSSAVQSLCEKQGAKNVHALIKTINKVDPNVLKMLKTWDEVMNLFVDRNVLRAMRALDGEREVQPLQKYVRVTTSTPQERQIQKSTQPSKRNISWMQSRPSSSYHFKNAVDSKTLYNHLLPKHKSVKLSKKISEAKSDLKLESDKALDRAWLE